MCELPLTWMVDVFGGDAILYHGNFWQRAELIDISLCQVRHPGALVGCRWVNSSACLAFTRLSWLLALILGQEVTHRDLLAHVI